MGVTEREEREKGIEETFETTMAENFPPVNVRHQTRDSGSSENNSVLHLGVSFSN